MECPVSPFASYRSRAHPGRPWRLLRRRHRGAASPGVRAPRPPNVTSLEHVPIPMLGISSSRCQS
eukprot:1022869-Pyramimonas_sp.AAC.1